MKFIINTFKWSEEKDLKNHYGELICLLLRRQGVAKKDIEIADIPNWPQFAKNEDIIYFNGESYLELDLQFLLGKIKRYKLHAAQVVFHEENTSMQGLNKEQQSLMKKIPQWKGHDKSSDYFIPTGIYYFSAKIAQKKISAVRHALPLSGFYYHHFSHPRSRADEVSIRQNTAYVRLKFGPRPALFLDRDGVLIKDKNYLKDPAELEINEDLIPLLKYFQDRRYRLLVLSNQSGIARGKLTEEENQQVTSELHQQLRARGVYIDHWYYCPYLKLNEISLPYGRDSFMRKPFPGMVWKAQRDFFIDLNKSFMIGDKESDKLDFIDIPTFLLKDQYDIAPHVKAEVFENVLDLRKRLIL